MFSDKLKMVIAFFTMVGVLTLSLMMGTDWASVISARGDPLDSEIFWALRLPRVAVAFITGAMLAIAGVASQSIFRNPLASPSILGISAGGCAFASGAIYLGVSGDGLSLGFASFLGCLLATALTTSVLLSFANQSTENMILFGLALSSFFSALTTLFVSLVSEQYQTMPHLLLWLLGHVEARTWYEIIFGGAVASFFLLFFSIWSTRLDALALGDEQARALGVDVSQTRILITIGIAALEAMTIYLCGAIAFIGLMVPHLTRLIMGPSHKRLLLISAVNGASLLMLADVLAREIFKPNVLQVGVVTSLIGSIFFIVLVMRRLLRVSTL